MIFDRVRVDWLRWHWRRSGQRNWPFNTHMGRLWESHTPSRQLHAPAEGLL